MLLDVTESLASSDAPIASFGILVWVTASVAILLVPVLMILFATELPGLQRGLLTEPLTGRQWFTCLGLAALLPIIDRCAAPSQSHLPDQPGPSDVPGHHLTSRAQEQLV